MKLPDSDQLERFAVVALIFSVFGSAAVLAISGSAYLILHMWGLI